MYIEYMTIGFMQLKIDTKNDVVNFCASSFFALL